MTSTIKALSVQTLYAYCKRGLCITRAQYMDYLDGQSLKQANGLVRPVTIGAQGANNGVSITNSAEQKVKVKSLMRTNAWVRAELRCWQGKANIIAHQIHLKDLWQPFTLRQSTDIPFCQTKWQGHNKRRRQPVKWWLDYLQTEIKKNTVKHWTYQANA